MRYHLLGALALMLAAAGTPARAADELIIGYSMAKTGPYVSMANTNEVAVDLAVEEINAKGGVNGKKLKVVKFDTGGDPKQAVLAVRRFAEDEKALAIIGPFSSSEVRVAFPVGERAGIVQTSMASSAPGLAKDFKFGFRNTTDEGRLLDEVVATLKEKGLPSASAAIAYATDDTVSKAIGTAVLPKVFEKHKLPVKISVDFQLNAFDLSPQVSQLAQFKPDIVGLGSPPEAAINLAKELRRQGVRTRIIGGATASDPDLPMRMDGAGETMTLGTTYFSDVNDSTRAFAALFRARAKAAKLPRTEPSLVDAAVYTIVYMYAEAMKQGKITGEPAKLAAERVALRDGLVALKDFPAIEGKISFNEDHDALKPIYVLEIKGGKWTLLDTRTPK